MSDRNNDAALREFVAVMVHDLNNPIAALGTNLGFLETLVGSACSAEMAETLSDLRMLCDILRRLTGNLGFLGQKDHVSVRRITLDVMALAMGAVERLEPQARASEVSLELDKRTRTGQVFVESDPALCERALDNLLAFAIERAVMRSSIVISLMKDTRVGVNLQCTTRPEASDLSGHVSRSRELQAAHGRGLSLLCARLAVEAAGGRLEVLREAPNRLVLDLNLHTGDKQIA